MNDVERYRRDQRELERKETGCGCLVVIVVVVLMFALSMLIAPALVNP